MSWPVVALAVVGLLVLALILLVWIGRERRSTRTRFGFFIERDRDDDRTPKL